MWYRYFKYKFLQLIRNFLLSHPPVPWRGQKGAGGRLQQERGGDARDRDGEERRDWGSSTPLGRVWTTAGNTCCPGWFCPLAYWECLPTSGPLVWVHAAMWSCLDGWVVLQSAEKSFIVSYFECFLSRFLLPVPSGKHCSLARSTAAAESPRLPCLLPDWVHHHDRLLGAALPGVDPTARIALPSTSPWSTGQCTLG